MKTTLLPAIRSRVGDWVTYITSMSFKEVEALLKAPDEVHERKALSDWIQREAIDAHAEEVSNYIRDNPQRFLGSLIVGVYGGHPNWAPLNIKIRTEHLDVTQEQEEKIEGKLGLLHLTGEEKLFAIDGQHRVSGIKKVISEIDEGDPINSDEVSAIFVAHDASTDAGKIRTRRLFTTVNKKAKKISRAAIIALDEDNGVAIVTRMLIDNYWLFEDQRKHILYSSTGSIPAQNETAITSVVGLYEIVRDLYAPRKRKKFESLRPDDAELSTHLGCATEFFSHLIDQCAPLNSVLKQGNLSARHYREEENHLLFRPIGQRAFARATQLLVERGWTLESSVSSLLKADLNVYSANWHSILWDPIGETMITSKLALAETQLLRLSGHEARTSSNKRSLDELLAARNNV